LKADRFAGAKPEAGTEHRHAPTAPPVADMAGVPTAVCVCSTLEAHAESTPVSPARGERVREHGDANELLDTLAVIQ